jgi:transcriptional regulator with XRE-family HTH domain
MPIDVYTAAGILGRCLRDARMAKGLTGYDVGRACDLSSSAISRMEAGSRSVNRPMLEFLVALYDIDTDRARQLEAYRQVARSISPFDSFRQHLPTSLVRFYAAQTTAVSLQEFSIGLVPALLRAPEYQQAILHVESEGFDPQQWLRLIQMARDLTKDVDLTFILAEEVLGRMIGGYDVMVEQLDALHDAAADPRVQIRIVPYCAGVLPSHLGFALLTHEVPDEEITAYGHGVLSPAAPVQREYVPSVVARWSRLEDVASKPEDLDRMLGQALTRLKDHQRTPS